MALRAVEAGSTWWYTPEIEKRTRIITKDGEEEDTGEPLVPEEERTKFELRFLTAKERTRLQNMSGTLHGDEFRPTVGTMTLEALKIGVVGWKKLLDKDGHEVEFCGKKNGRGEIVGALEGDIDKIPHQIRRELTEAITEGSSLTEDDEKN